MIKDNIAEWTGEVPARFHKPFDVGSTPASAIKQKVSTTLFCEVLSCWPLFFLDKAKRKRVMKYLTKNSHCAGSGDAPTPRHPVIRQDVRVAAEPEPFLLANLSGLTKKLIKTALAPLLHKLGHRLNIFGQTQDFEKYGVMI